MTSQALAPARLVAACETVERPLRHPGGLRRAIAKYVAVAAITAHNQLAYLGQAFVSSIFLVLILFVFLQLWTATYASQAQPLIGGFTVAQMLWYLALTEAIVVSRPRLNRIVDAEVRTGDVAYTLVRPYSYAAFRFAGYFAERLTIFGIKILVAVGLALLYVGPVPLDGGHLALGAAALGLAMAIDFLISFSIALLAFWTENTSSITLIYDRLVMLLGGMLLPLEVFPEPLANIARALPFSSLVYAPARLALGGAGEPPVVIFTRQGATLIVTALVAWLIYRAALRRVNVNGG